MITLPDGITVVGLGPGSPALLTQGAVQALCSPGTVVLRTEVHPTTPALRAMGVEWRSFDALYEQTPTFELLYDRMVDELLSLAQRTPVIFAVPGHPLVAEASVRLLLERAPAAGIPIHVVSGTSFLDALFTALALDPACGLEVLDALNLERTPPSGHLPLLLAQVYSRETASEAKLQLMAVYPDDHPVTVVRAAGIPGEERQATVPLFELDRLPWVDHLTSVYVPSLAGRRPARQPLDPLVDVMARLRGPGGCPWDLEQDHRTLRPYMLEEAYEAVEAIDAGDMTGLREELGDVLLQVVFHAQMASERGEFNIGDIIAGITEKLIRRHPHVFGDVTVRGSGDVVRNWEAIKAQEKGGVQKPASILDGVGQALPALKKAESLQKKAAKVGFDWPDIQGPLEKLAEEIAELQAARSSGNQQNQEEELGDLLFAAVNVARFLHIDPEIALNLTNGKFIRRFHHVELAARRQGRSLEKMNLQEMDLLWAEAKRAEHPKN